MDRRRYRDVFSKLACMVIVLVFMATTIITPVYGITENTETEIAQEQSDEAVTVEAEITEEELPQQTEVQEYEKSADSWRYEDGYNISESEQQAFYSEGTIDGPSYASFVPWSKTSKGYINSRGTVISGAVKKGIDVSSWQGTIDWKKVKEDGIDFAIIRCGFGSDQENQDDSQWLRNVKQCEKYGIPYGVYLYSYANTTTKAKSEAQHTLRLLREANADPDYPVYYDLEDKLTRKETPAEIVNYAKIFCSAIEAAGYEAGIYANYDWWTNVLYDIPKDPAFDQYDRWVAQYYYRCDYDDDEYRLWQCSSSYYVDGIDGKVDLNFEFELENETNRTTDIWSTDKSGNVVYIDSEGEIAKSRWIKYRGSTYYVNSVGKRLVGRWYIGDKRYYFNKYGRLVKSSWISYNGYKYYATSDGSFAKGYKKIGGYYYLFNSNGVMRKSSATVNGKYYKIYSSGKARIYTAKTKTALNYRTGPSTGYRIKGTYKRGSTVYAIRTYNGWTKLSTGYWVKSSYLNIVTTYPKKVSAFKPYSVKTTTALNYRTGPSTGYKIKGTYKKGTVRKIVAVKNGWGKTSAGYWIKLSYTRKI